jgi:hypothetical protein
MHAAHFLFSSKLTIMKKREGIKRGRRKRSEKAVKKHTRIERKEEEKNPIGIK